MGARSGSADFGRYEIRELLGQGGMGVVHRAYDTVHDRVVALKRLSAAATDHEYRARFQRESRIAAGLSHPNVIPVNDFGEVDGHLFLDMMLVEGTDLRRAMGAGGVDPVRALKVLGQVAAALDAANGRGLVHRDVKPSNILIAADDHAYLADFGIARETSPEATALTRSGDLIGSWDYMAPERLSGGAVDGRSDQYSLACVLFECLTGRLPHPAADPAAKVAAHLLQPPPAPSVFSPTVSPALDAVVLRGLAKDPARRFESATALIAAAEAAAFGGDTEHAARPTSPGPAEDQDRLVRAILRSTTRPRPSRPQPAATPYPGLSGFEQSDADLFHGRSHVVTELLVRLAEQVRGGEPVVLVGASGAGKSSVLKAGLLPALAGDGDETWPQVVLTPGVDPVGNLAAAMAARTAAGPGGGGAVGIAGGPAIGMAGGPLVGPAGGPAVGIAAGPVVGMNGGAAVGMSGGPAGGMEGSPVGGAVVGAVGGSAVGATAGAAQWARLIRESPGRFGEWCAGAKRPVIVVDQFEEVFNAPEADRLAFAAALTAARPALVVLAVRADLLDRCIELAPLRPALAAPVLLGPLDATGLRQAIVSPAKDFGVEVEPGLPERMIADLGVRGEIGYDPGALPRLAHALRESWLHRDGPVLTLAAYRRAGGIDGAVSRTAEEIHSALDPVGRQALRTILLRLVAVLDDGAVVRRRVDPREFAAQRHVLDRLIAARLVTVDGSGARLSHEALFTAWPRLRDWIEEDRAGLVQHRRFTDSVRAWVESGQHDDDLYRGVRLASLTTWLESARDRVRLQPVEQDFLARSTAAEHAGQLAARKRTNRLRGLVAALSLLLVVASVAVVVATRLQQSAQAERDRADTGRQQNLSRQLAAESALARTVDPRRAALAAFGAWRASPTVEGRSALLSATTDAYRGRMTGHVGAINALAVSGDGKVAASGGRDGTLRLWDVPSRRELAVLDDKGGWYRTVSMSADGRLLATADPDATKVELWDVPARKRIFTVPGRAVDTALSPDGGTLVAYTDRGVVLWETAGFTERAVFAAEPSIRMVFLPDPGLVALTHGNDVAVHRAADGALVAKLTGHTGEVSALAFAPGGGLLASTGMDATVRLWDTTTWTTRRTFSAPEVGLSSVAFTPSGSAVVAGAVGSSVYSWDLATGDLLTQYAAGSVTTFAVVMTADGRTLLSSDSTGVITVWSYQRTTLGPRDAVLLGTAFQPGGDLLATTSGNGVVRLWDHRNSRLAHELKAHGDDAYDVAFSPDGSELVTVDESGLLVVWKAATGAEARRFSRPGTEFTSARFSPDGRTIAVTGRTPTGSKEDRDEVLLLDAADLELVNRRATTPEPRNTPVNGVEPNYPTGISFHPNGRTLAVTLSGGRIGLWDLVDPGTEWTVLPGHDGVAIDVEFSPDGSVLATGGGDRLVKLWRVKDGVEVGVLTGNDAPVRRVAWSPDGRMLATASQDTVVRLWEVDGARQLARLDRHGAELNDLAFDPSGELIASVGADGTARLWDLVPDRAVEVLCGLLDRESLAEEWRALGPDRGDPPGCPE
ncbi:serine/threonine-protein kinase [Saccharothrix luteola]|uniref:serine/threonine-protein kinase n=1 Tax=Saccharothrix luteola TaxID=2893018 RepID=UPI001E2B16EE|nr:serine/threonine-protein kinase [Saccharothrix luteola]MCC8249202.1 protein kinase [Saccharothrix luteola]